MSNSRKAASKNPLNTPDDREFMKRLRIENDTNIGTIPEYKNSAITPLKRGGKKRLYQVKTRG